MRNLGILALLLILFLVFLGGVAWYGIRASIQAIPIGFGNEKASPNERYVASTTSYYQDSSRGRKSWYIFQVRDKYSDVPRKSITIYPPAGTEASNFRAPGTDIVWTPDSHAVSFIANGNTIYSFTLLDK